MDSPSPIQSNIQQNGFAIIEDVFAEADVSALLDCIDQVDHTNPAVRKTKDVFAIRRFLQELPAARPMLFTPALNAIVSGLFGQNYFVVKSIYFDKPPASNWFVAYHQDLTISVKKKIETAGYGPWTVKPDQFAVQPPLPVLEDNFTIRIHLDDTDANNGALRVIPGSHLKGICRPEAIDRDKEKAHICEVNTGGIMIMKPLLLHASGRTTNNRKRRVVHIEFSKINLPEPLQWAELIAWPGSMPF